MNSPFESIMVRTLLGPLVTVTQLFGLYVLIHGHYSPGGGFQAGVLVAAVFILPMLIFGRSAAGRTPPGLIVIGPRGSITMAAVGVLIFAGVGLVSVARGQAMLDYAHLPLPLDEPMRRSMGILIIEIGVTMGVAGSVMSIFHSLYQDPPEDTVA